MMIIIPIISVLGFIFLMSSVIL